MLFGICFFLLSLSRLPACASETTSLLAADLQPQNPGPVPPTNLQLYNATHVSRIPDNETLSIPLPYSFSVPNTETYLRLGFGLVRRRLDPMSLGGLIALIQDEIVRGIETFGEDAFPGLNVVAATQQFGWSLGDGFHFEVYNVMFSGTFFTWRQLGHVVEGLRLFLVVGRRPFATEFRFWDGPREWWRTRLGGGAFVVDRDEMGGIAALED